MRVITALALALALFAPLASAQIVPEEISIETMSDPGPNWFISKTGNGGYIFDAATGEMQGMLSLSRYTPAITCGSLDVNSMRPNPTSPEACAASVPIWSLSTILRI